MCLESTRWYFLVGRCVHGKFITFLARCHGTMGREDIYIVEIHELPHARMKSYKNAISAYYFGCKATKKFKINYNPSSLLLVR